MISRLIDPLLSLHGAPVYVLVGALAFAEAAILVGFVFPGETAVLLGGVLASEGNAELAILIPVVVLCAIAGDSVGYAVGRRFGPRLLEVRVLRKRRGALDAATNLLRRRGAWAVFFGRFTAFLRAMVPGLAGISGMHYPTFLVANALGGLVWGTAFVLIGYAVGHAYQQAEKISGEASIAMLVVLVAIFAILAVRSRRRERALEADAASGREPGAEQLTAHAGDAKTPGSGGGADSGGRGQRGEQQGEGWGQAREQGPPEPGAGQQEGSGGGSRGRGGGAGGAGGGSSGRGGGAGGAGGGSSGRGGGSEDAPLA